MNPHAWNEGDGKSIAISNSRVTTPITGSVRKKTDSVGENYLVAIGSRTARFRRKQQERIIILILIIWGILLLIILIIVSAYHASGKRKPICETPQCIRSASNLLLSMDPSANPCENFYQYACGNWAEEHPKPDFLSSYDWFTDKRRKVERIVRDILSTNISDADPVPFNQAKDMFMACSNTKSLDSLGLTTVLDFLASVNLPPVPTYLNITKSSNQGSYAFNWLTSIVNIKKRIEMDILIGFDIYSDPKNNSKKVIIMGEPSGEEPFPSYTELDKLLPKIKKKVFLPKKSAEEAEENKLDDDDEEAENETKRGYKNLYQGVMREFIKAMDSNTLLEISDEDLNKNIDNAITEYFAFSKNVYRISDELENELDSSENIAEDTETLEYSVDNLQTETNTILTTLNMTTKDIWKPYLLGLFNGTSITLNFTKDTILFTNYDLNYLYLIIPLILSTPPEKLEMYIWLQVVENFLPHTTSTIREMYEKYMRTMIGVESNIPRSIRCASTVSQLMGMAVAYGIADSTFIEHTLPKVQRMFNNIQTSFEDLVMSLNWMDTPTKAVSIEKVRNMKSLIGFPPWLLQPGKLEEYYKGVEIDPSKHIENQLSLKEVGFMNKLNLFREPYVFSWETEPTEVNAFHTFQANAITIPLVMLQYPFYDLGLEALNYGSIGTVLGHELTHGFDNLGRQYDKYGILVQWWTNRTIESFVNRTKCFIKQYSNFYIEEIDKHVDGNKTLGENIADNGGVRSALKGYWKERKEKMVLPGLTHLSGDQLFFLAYGNLWCGVRTKKSLNYDIHDEHSPSYLRLKGVLQNIPEFSRAWKCPVNSTMNPAEPRCIIF